MNFRTFLLAGAVVALLPQAGVGEEVVKVPASPEVARQLDFLFLTTKLVPEDQVRLVAAVAPPFKGVVEVMDTAKKGYTESLVKLGFLPTRIQAEAEVKKLGTVMYILVRTRVDVVKDNISYRTEHWFCAKLEETLVGNKLTLYEKVKIGAGILPKASSAWREFKVRGAK